MAIRGLYESFYIPPLGTNDGVIDDVFINKYYTILWQLVRKFRSVFQMWGSIKITRVGWGGGGNSITLLGAPPTLNSWQSAKSSLPSEPLLLLFHHLHIEWVRPGWLLLRRPFLKTLFNAASPQNLDTWPCFVCFEAVVTIISYFYKKLVYCLFVWLKCKPHGIRNYASALFAFSTDPSTEVNAQYFLNKLINCLTKIQIWYWGCFPWIFWLNRTEVKPKARNKSTSGDLDDQATLRITPSAPCYSLWPTDQQPEHHQGACHKCRFSALPETHWVRTGVSKIPWWSVP